MIIDPHGDAMRYLECGALRFHDLQAELRDFEDLFDEATDPEVAAEWGERVLLHRRLITQWVAIQDAATRLLTDVNPRAVLN